MAIPVDMETLLNGARIESERVEFKETWDPQTSLKTICAFANDLNNWGGGYVVIGVRELEGGPRELLGVQPQVVDAWQKDILNKCKLIQPDYMPVCDCMEYEGKTFIVLWCPGGSTRPYSSPKSMGKKSGRIQWVRHISSTVEPGVEEARDLFTLANNVPFDDRPNHFAEMEDLSLPLMRSYLKNSGSSLYNASDSIGLVELCESLHIVSGPSEALRPLNVGLLFFCLDPRKFFPYAQIDVVEMPDGEGGDTLIEHTFSGPLDAQIQDSLRYLMNNVVAEYVIKDPKGGPSTRFFNYPKEALKEAIANAVYHKGYDSREPIEIRVLPDRIEVLSHPGADRSISLDGLKSYKMACRRYRNRRIGEFLKELGLTEGRNTGVHKILRALRLNGSPEPLFETDEDRLYFMLTIYARQLGPTRGGKAAVMPKEKRYAAILELMRENPDISNFELVQHIDASSATVNRDIADLKRLGKVRRESRKGPWILG